MKYQDATSYVCKCGQRLTVPYPSMQNSPTLAPSEQDLKTASYVLTQKIIYHQNNDCSYMHNERQKLMLATKPKSILIENL